MHGRSGVAESTPTGYTPALHAAVEADDRKAVARLLSAGNGVDTKNAAGQTPLMLAAQLGSLETLQALIDAGARVDARDRLNHTALMHAAARQSTPHVLALMRGGADPRARGLWDDNGGSITALDAALLEGGTATAQAIEREVLRAFALVDQREALAIDEAGNTPLHWVARYGGAGGVRLLLDRGGALEARNCPRRPSDDQGPRREDLHSATPLLIALSHGNVAAAGALIEAGASARVLDDRGRGALHVMRRQPSLSLIPQLLRGGAAPELVDREGKTPAEALASYGLRGEYVAALKAEGIAVRHATATRDDVFGVIARLGDPNTPQRLRDNPVALTAIVDGQSWLVEERNEQGQTALFDAALFGLGQVIKVLAARGASVDVKDNTGRTPIFRARDRDTLRTLVELGADINAQDLNGETPLHVWAGANGSLGAVEALLQAGASSRVRSTRGETAEEVARRAGNPRIANAIAQQL
jgi:ankyrin repeat protein